MLLDLDAIAGLVFVLLVVRLVAASRARTYFRRAGRALCGRPRPRPSSSSWRSMTLPIILRRKPCALVARSLGVGRGCCVVSVMTASPRSSWRTSFFSAQLRPRWPPAWRRRRRSRRRPAFRQQPTALRSRRSVMTRARSRFVLRIWLVSSSRLVKFFSRFWNVSRASDVCSSRRSSTLLFAQVVGFHTMLSSRA